MDKEEIINELTKKRWETKNKERMVLPESKENTQFKRAVTPKM
jgi:hypothetical protein